MLILSFCEIEMGAQTLDKQKGRKWLMYKCGALGA